MKQLVGIYKKGVTIEVTSKTSDEGGFCVQDFFNNLYEEKEEAGVVWTLTEERKRERNSAHAVLFGDKDTNTKSILSRWKIVYDKKGELLAPMCKEEERGMIPLD
jgi:hypothetical protein